MLEISLATQAQWSRPVHLIAGLPPVADTQALALVGLGEPGIAEGFTALDDVTGYTASAGRYRLGPNGFVECGADEERLCFDSSGNFIGQMLEAGDTHYSAPWHDPAAPNTSSDPAYLQPRAGGSIAYAGEHSEPDIFGGFGGGVIITQTDADGSFHIAQNVQAASVAVDDVLRFGAILSIDTPEAGRVGLRGAGNRSFAFEFDHDADGNITGFTEQWATYRAGYHDMGTINGKRWWFLWVDTLADNTGAEQRVAINYSGTSAGAGRKLHICDLRLQVNPATAPSAVPVCAANKTFEPDTLFTTLSDAGYVCDGLRTCRSTITGGAITPPAIELGVPYEPLETRIAIVDGVEATDRSGVLHNENIELYVTPWRNPVAFDRFFGPSYFPSPWLVTDSNKGCGDAAIIPVFQRGLDARPLLGTHNTSHTHLTGTLTTDHCIFLGAGFKVTEYFEQASIIAPSSGSMFFLQAGDGVSARDCLVMGASLHTTRARDEIQADATPSAQVYPGEFSPQVAGGSIDVSGTFFSHLARFSVSSVNGMNEPVDLNINDTGFDYIWSDFVYVSSGAYAAAQASRRFHGRATSDSDLTLWQSRKAIQRDNGSGFEDYDVAGFTLADLPQGGQAWQHVGVWDFDADDWVGGAPVADPAKSVKVRYWKAGSISGKVSKEGYQWHANQMDMGSYSRHPDQGDVFELTVGGETFRVFYDYGSWSNSSTYTSGPLPAQTSTGTHTDNVQVNRSSVRITGWTEHDCVFLNKGQGEFLTGLSNLSSPNGSEISGYDVDGLVAILEANNAFRFDWSHAPNSECDVANSVFVEMVSKLRLTDGGEGPMVFGVAGDNNTLNVGVNVWVFSSASSPTSIQANGTLTGTVNTTQLPRAENYGEYSSSSLQTVPLSDVLLADDVDASSGQAAEIDDPWTFRFATTASTALGFDPNPIIATARGSHTDWFPVVDDLVSHYFREPDLRVVISASTPVGTVVLSGVTARGFHARYGANYGGCFAIVGGDLVVAKPLTGIDRIFVMRGDNDQRIDVDVKV